MLTCSAGAEPTSGAWFTPQGQAILDAFVHRYEKANDSFRQQPLDVRGATASGWQRGSLNLLSGLPEGAMERNSIDWQIAPTRVGADSPAQVEVNQKVDVLFFLHTCDPGAAVRTWWHQAAIEKRRGERPPERPVMFRYCVRYADQKELSIPVLFGESIERWYRVGPAGEMAHAQPVVLKQDVDTWENAVAYCMKWVNPRPEVAVVSVEATLEGATADAGLAVLLGVTSGLRTGPGGCYVIAPDGEDSGPGTWDQPWATPAKISALQPGDTLYVRGGVYRVTQPTAPTIKGTAEAWITITSWPGERPVFNAEEFVKTPELRNDKGSVFDFQACEFLRIQGVNGHLKFE
jgi:hypothetical protein